MTKKTETSLQRVERLAEIKTKIDDLFKQHDDTLTNEDVYFISTAIISDISISEYLDKKNKLSLDEITKKNNEMLNEMIECGIKTKASLFSIEERKNNGK